MLSLNKMLDSVKTPPAKRKKLAAKHVVLLLGFVILFVVATVLLWPYLSLFSDPDRARSLIEQAGPWGPLMFIGLQIVQVLIAPIPGTVTGFAGGYLFGTFLGTLYAIIGATIGFTIIFVLARKLGRPFVEYFVDKKHLKKFDYIAESNGTFVLFLIFLLPVFPDDIICYLAGLTNIKIRTLILISLAGRLPGYIVLSFAGSGVAESNITLVSIIVTLLLIISAIGFWQRKRLERFVKRLSDKKDTKKE